ncbi:MAG: response regulator transcription factor [Akkermansiaceae bacterium]|nr:response regulator transcription factor [Akkermansiaceae bacterium]
MLVDDHFIVRVGLAGSLALEPGIQIVAECGTGEEAVEVYTKCMPDVLLMDWRLPGMNGVEATQCILGKHSSGKVIILSAFEGQEDIYRAVEAGVSGYLPKSVRRRELLTAIRKVHGGDHYFPIDIWEKFSERKSGAALSGKELAVLRLIARGFSNKEIASDLNVAEVIVKFYVGSILKKMNVSDRTQAAMEELQRGIMHLD